MIIEFGNHAALLPGIDDRPKVTTMHIPEADETGAGGFTHAINQITADEFRAHRAEAADFRGGITQLPDHELLLTTVGAWPAHASDRPAWVKCTDSPGHEYMEGQYRGRTPAGRSADVENFLREFYRLDKEAPGNIEDLYWTRFGPPGVGGISLPEITNTFTNTGRVISNVNDGGGLVGALGVGSAATTTSLTVSGTPGWASNAYAGYRIVVQSLASNNIVWGNITANGTGTNPSITVDQWYNFATPGGAAGTTPGTPWAFAILDGGFTSAWFMALATGANAVGATDTSLSTNGNTEYFAASGGYNRAIAAYTQTSGVASRTYTMAKTFTGNGSDSYPQTFTVAGLFVSMIRTVTTLTMKFEDLLSPGSATVAASGDAVTVTQTVTGS